MCDHACGISCTAERCCPSYKEEHQYPTRRSRDKSAHLDVDPAVLLQHLAKPDRASEMARLVIVVPLRLPCLVLSPGLAKQHLVVDHAPHDGPADAEASLACEYQPSKVAREVVGREEGGEGGEERQKGGGRPGWGGQAPLELDELLLELPQLPADRKSVV